jgi:hypothetical protein
MMDNVQSCPTRTCMAAVVATAAFLPASPVMSPSISLGLWTHAQVCKHTSYVKVPIHVPRLGSLVSRFAVEAPRGDNPPLRPLSGEG